MSSSEEEILFHIHIDEFHIHMKIHMHSHYSSLTERIQVQGSAVRLDKQLAQIVASPCLPHTCSLLHLQKP